MSLRILIVMSEALNSLLDAWVVSMQMDQLMKIDRSIGVAGGNRKHAAIQGAVLGGWINFLVTDRATAEWLLL